MKLKNFYSFVISSLVLVLMLGAFAYASVRIDRPFDRSATPQYAVLFWPGTSTNEAIRIIVKAGGRPVRTGGYDFLFIAASTHNNFQVRVENLGAFLVFSPIIKGGCIIENRTPFKKI